MTLKDNLQVSFGVASVNQVKWVETRRDNALKRTTVASANKKLGNLVLLVYKASERDTCN